MSTSERFWTGLFCAFVTLLAWVIVASAVRHNPGRASDEHPGPVPARVVELTPGTYLIKYNARVTGSNLCWRNNTQGDPAVEYVNPVPDLNGTLVECQDGQTWNAGQRIKKSYWSKVGDTVNNSFYWVLASVVLLLVLIPAIVSAVGDERRHRSERARSDRKNKQKKVTAQNEREALAAAFANDLIDETRFTKGLDEINARLLREGVDE